MQENVDGTSLLQQLIALREQEAYDQLLQQAGLWLQNNPSTGEVLAEVAFALVRKDRFAEAEQAAVAALNINQNLWVAVRALVIVRFSQKRMEDALELANTLLQPSFNYTSHADMARALNTIVACLSALGRTEEAHQRAAQALKLADIPEVYLNLAQMALRRKDFAQATLHAKQALERKPDLNPAWQILAFTLIEQERCEEAIPVLRRVLATDPNKPTLLTSLAECLRRMGCIDEALPYARRAVELAPQEARSLIAYATLLQQKGNIREARGLYDQALRIEPNNIGILNNLAAMCQETQDHQNAIALLHRARELAPDNPVYTLNLSGVLLHCSVLTPAMALVDEVLAKHPDLPDALIRKGNILTKMGMVEESLEWLARALKATPDDPQLRSNILFAKNYICKENPIDLCAEATEYGKCLTHWLEKRGKLRPVDFSGRDQSPDRPLRVGFVSGDFKNHPIGYEMEGIATALRGRPDSYYFYQAQRKEDDLTARLKACGHHWREVCELSDDELFALIQQDAIDILVDLSGHTSLNRLPVFARRAAPVQASWFGYMGTTGLETMDYYICDERTLPPGADKQLTERPMRLPHVLACFARPVPDVTGSAAPVLQNGFVTFGSFNNASKITDEVVRVWSEILLAVPSAKLMLKYKQFGDKAIRENMAQRFSAHGIDSERLILEGHSPRQELLLAYNQIDIALDTFPYAGTTTTAEAFIMGVPVLTRKGFSIISRQGESLLHTIGLPDFIATDNADYVRKAAELAADPQRLDSLRTWVREEFMRCHLGNCPAFADDLEGAFRQMWREYTSEKE